MNIRFACITAFLAVVSVMGASAQTAGQDSHYVTASGQLIHCVSGASGRTYCGTSHTRYSLQGNADPRCVEGRTWGLDDRGVWVADGCVADFSPISADYVDGSGQIVHCVSTASGRTYCGAAKTRYTISGTPDPRCIEGQTWGLDDRGVWVTNGCVADFSPSSGEYLTSNGELVHCVATASGRAYCGSANTRYVIAGTPDPRCIEGQTWGLDDRGVWVANGCVADFSPARTDYVDSSGQLVHCISTATGRTYCGTAKTRYTISGTPDPRCIEGQTWGLDDRGVWVANGCVADFSPSPVYSNVSGKLIRCDAVGGGRTYCRNVANRHYLLKETREGKCVEGESWGMDDKGLWVSGDCHGDFDDEDENEEEHEHEDE